MNSSNVEVDIKSRLAGRSLYWLAKASGVPYSTLHKIARNKTDGISFLVLERLADALECQPGALIVSKQDKNVD